MKTFRQCLEEAHRRAGATEAEIKFAMETADKWAPLGAQAVQDLEVPDHIAEGIIKEFTEICKRPDVADAVSGLFEEAIQQRKLRSN